MTDQPETTPAADAAAPDHAAPDAAAATSTADITTAPGASVAAVTDGVYYLIVAQFPDTAAASKAYDALRELETTTTLAIDGVVVARREADGKVHLEQLTEHSTRTGLGWGVVGGIALAALFPPSLLAGAVGGGVIGSAAGKIRNLVRRSEVEKELESSLEPGTSGILALVEDQAAAQVQRALAEADRIVSKSVDKALAMEIDAEAAAAKKAAGV
jgi:uncharacterized membrane protein